MPVGLDSLVGTTQATFAAAAGIETGLPVTL
jgi:hypothetical protein